MINNKKGLMMAYCLGRNIAYIIYFLAIIHNCRNTINSFPINKFNNFCKTKNNSL